ncbi:MAG: helix-turn-helix domain-containing protein [Fidelibacterota bacterium]
MYSQEREITLRLRELIDKQVKWARDLGISQQRLSNYIKGRAPNQDFLIRLLEKKRININWLLTGKGDKFITYKERMEGIPAEIKERILDYPSGEEKALFFKALEAHPKLYSILVEIINKGETGVEALSVLKGYTEKQLKKFIEFSRSLQNKK